MQPNLYDSGLEILRSRKIRFADRFIPYFFSAYSMHLFNLMNRRRRIYFEHKRIPDMRLQTLIIAPPGFSKSLFMRQCFDEEVGILYSDGVKTTFEGTCTEAAWVGTYDKVGGSSVKVEGLAEEYKEGIVAIEEFTAITRTLEQQHSLTFEPQLAATLWEGEVRKRVAKGPPIRYHTDVTLIGGTVIMRFEIAGGLGRRFFYIYWVPSPSDFAELREAVRNGVDSDLKSVNEDRRILAEYRARLSKFQSDIDNISRISFSDGLYDFFNGRPHFEHLIYRKLALGYALFSSDGVRNQVSVELDGRLKRLLSEAMEWRDQLLADPECSQVLELIKSHGGVVSKGDLQKELLGYSINWDGSSYIVDKLVRMGKVKPLGGGRLELV